MINLLKESTIHAFLCAILILDLSFVYLSNAGIVLKHLSTLSKFLHHSSFFSVLITSFGLNEN